MEGDERSPEPASAKQLLLKLAGELKAARKSSGQTVSAWLREANVGYSRGHISNVERGRDRPSAKLVAAYDEAFSSEADKTRLQRMRAEWIAAEEVEKRRKRAVQARQERSRQGPPANAESTEDTSLEDPRESPGGRRRLALLVGTVIVVLTAVVLVAVMLPLGEPSQEEFAQQADEICADTEQPLKVMQARLARLGRLLALGDPSAGDVLDHEIVVLRALIRDRIERFRDLDLPSGEAGELASDFVTGTDRAAYAGLAILERMDEKVMAGEVEQALQELRDRANFDQEAIRRDDLAERLGARECARIGLGRPWGR